MPFDYGAATHVGLRRSENQDRYLAHNGLFAVADGIGSHWAGGTAAGIATEVLARVERVESLQHLITLVGAANRAILDAALGDPHMSEMATTLCVLGVVGTGAQPPRLAACNVGDSRLYALDRDCLSLLTVDHTITENLLRDGLISEADAARHADRHTLTRAVGIEQGVYVDAWELSAIARTRFLLCSDGLTNEVSEFEIAEILRTVEDPSAAAVSLVERAVRPGHGRDNVTTVVVDVVDDADDPDSRPDPGDSLVLAFEPAVLC